MATFRKVKEKPRYDFLDEKCIGRACFSPGKFNHYNTSISGANSVTNNTYECLNRCYRGCNNELDINKYNPTLAKQRKWQGWKLI
jgi:hypothetical protein